MMGIIFKMSCCTVYWPNGWVFVYELSGSGFESSCSHLVLLSICLLLILLAGRIIKSNLNLDAFAFMLFEMLNNDAFAFKLPVLLKILNHYYFLVVKLPLTASGCYSTNFWLFHFFEWQNLLIWVQLWGNSTFRLDKIDWLVPIG